MTKVIETDDQTVMRYSAQWFDRPNQITHGWLVYEFIERDGLVRRKVSPFRLRYLFHEEGKRLLERAGFHVSSVFGDYSGNKFTSKSNMMIFVAEKKDS